MKLLPNITLPAQLPPVSAAASSGSGMTGIDSRLAPSIPLPFSPTDLLWRYGPTALAFSPTAHHPTSPFFDFKTHLPNNLASDPRNWSRDDVATFLRWAEREFDLPQFDMDMFQMNGKALCLLTKSDLGERCPGAGDVLHNILNMLARDFNQLQRCLPGSPVTPTRPTASYPLSPHSHPPTPTWVDNHYAANLASLMSANSVTLSPAPSVDSQAGSPGHNSNGGGADPTTLHAPSSQGNLYKSDSDEDTNVGTNNNNQQSNNHSHHHHHHHHHHNNNNNNSSSNNNNNNNNSSSSASPPATPTALTAQRLSEVCVKDERSPTLPPMHVLPLTPGGANYRPDVQFKREAAFFPSDSPEPTNGRLLWDFLQQLLNDPSQRYTHYIAWKSRETGVFKIVDPPGLARLWGIQKNHLSMNYDKMSRALRYYYRVNILRKVQGERHCYQFLRNPTELKNIKNISLLRQQMRIKAEPGEEETTTLMEPEVDMPTDLSMSSMNSQQVNNNQDPLKTPTSNGTFDIPEHSSSGSGSGSSSSSSGKMSSIYEHAKHQFESHKSAFEPKSPFEQHHHASPHLHHHHQDYKSQFEPPQLQPLPLLDPPAKYRSHAYSLNLAKIEAQQQQQQQSQSQSQQQTQQQSQQMPPPQPMQIQQTQIIVEDRK